MTTEVPCPSCGFFTIGEDYFGTYSICDVCGWEDDGVQLANPASGGGANTESLIQSQKDIIIKFPLNINEYKAMQRDSTWRPLNDAEIAFFENEKQETHWKNKAILNLQDAYWKKA